MYSIERFSGCWNHQKLSGKFKFLAKNEVLQLEFFEKPLEKEDEICDLTFEIYTYVFLTRVVIKVFSKRVFYRILRPSTNVLPGTWDSAPKKDWTRAIIVQ